jgi:LysM repeat protein
MYDALYPTKIPTTIDHSIIIAAYIDNSSNPTSLSDAISRFPNNEVVAISDHGNPQAPILDVETGAMDPGNAVAITNWVSAVRAREASPTVYATSGNWGQVSQHCAAIGLAAPQWWLANWDGTEEIPAGTSGHQFTNSSIAVPPGAYDQSVMTDQWVAQFASVPAPAPSPAPTASTVTVRAGDTLSGIGAHLDVPWQSIAALNSIAPPYTIYPGEVLRISGVVPVHPNAPTHIVLTGENLTEIAAKYPSPSITWQSIARLNGIGAPYVIHAGQVLWIG